MKSISRLLLAFFLAIVVIMAIPSPAYAIAPPDSTPAIEDIWIWRNVLETGDSLLIVYENTPYATTPTDYTYSEAFIWRWMNGTTEIGQALGYDFNASGYGYNVIGFYLAAADAPAWAGVYTLTLSGTPSAFASPPEYSFPIPAGSYSLLTDTEEVKDDIAATIITIADDLRSKWGLLTADVLLQQTEMATVLSIAGESFFRGAIYGLQGMAPAAFSMTVENFTIIDRTWTAGFTANLTTQHSGSYIDTSLSAAQNFFGIHILGLLIVVGMGIGLLFINWYVAGGNIWRGAVEMAPVLVIGTRMALLGLGELSLLSALCMLYINARLWRVV